MENLWRLEFPYKKEDWEEPVFPSDHAWALQEKTIVLNQFIYAITCVDFP
jgi:hypothetical protein